MRSIGKLLKPNMAPTTPKQPAPLADAYLENFSHFEREAKQPAWMLPFRKGGLARFAELGFPTLQHEDWRFTNVAPIAKLPFKPVFEANATASDRGSAQGFRLRQPARHTAGVRERPLRGRRFPTSRSCPSGVKP